MNIKESPASFRAVQGPLVETIQAQLNLAGFDAGPNDGQWGKKTAAALAAWQQRNGSAQTGIVDDQTWTGLTKTPVPELSRRALQLTGDWEGTGYGGANGNFDGQGITWGVVGFTWANGELQDILKEIRQSYPNIFSAAFGQLEGQISQVLAQTRPAQMEFARGISIDGGERIQPPWRSAFKALGDSLEVQEIENRHAGHYWQAGTQFANLFGLQGEPGLALCFDIAVQNTVSDKMIAEVQSKIGGAMAEADKMQILAHVVADHANPTYYNDVLKRKMTFVTGQGTVHGELYDITCWGIG